MSLHFEMPLGAWTWAGAALLSGVVLSLMWRGTREAGTGRQRVVLMVLRGLVVLAVLAALAGPTLTWRPDDSGEQRLAVVVDASRSMTVRDGTNGVRRIDQALGLAQRVIEAAESDGDFEVTAYAVEESLRPLAGLERGDGEASLLRRSLERVDADDVVILSDGIETGPRGGEPLRCRVQAVAVGTDLMSVPNLGLAQVDFPETLDIGTQGAVAVEVVASGPAPLLASATSVPLMLRTGGVERAVATLDLSRGGRHPVTFQVEPTEEGYVHYELSLPAVEGEATDLDNRREFLVEVRRPDFRVLYYSARLDQEFRAIRRESAEMAGVTFTGVIEVSPGRFLVQGEKAGDDLGRGLPEDPDRLLRFHALVLGAFPASALGAPLQSVLREYVERGGGLIWLAAADGFGRGGWSASPLAAVSPLAFGPGDAAPVAQSLPVSVPAESARHPLARGIAAALEAVPAPLPVEGLYRFGALLPGAECVLAARGAGGVRVPAVAVRDVGKGRVVVLAASTWFRWRNAGGAAARAYAALWRQVLRHAAGRDEERARLSVGTDRERYDPGSTAVVRATVRNADFEPAAKASVTGALRAADGTVLGPLAFEPSAGEPGTFVADVQLGGPGILRAAVEARDASGLVGRRESLLSVGGVREGERTARDRDYLRFLAESAGGRVHEPGEIDALIEALVAPPAERETTVTRSLVFDGPWGFLLLFLLAVADWIVRRRLKLI